MMLDVSIKPPRSPLMPRRQKDPLGPLSADEFAELEHLSRSHTAPAAQVARAKALLAVAAGHRFTEAGHAAGRQSGDAVAQLVARFNWEGLAAPELGHGGGQPKRNSVTEQERILREVRRAPDRDQDKTATWSLSILQGALRLAPDRLPGISTYTIWCVLHDARFTWDKDRSWCQTGTAIRKRKSGTVTVIDRDGTAKKIDRGRVYAGSPAGVDRRRSRSLPDAPLSRRALASDREAGTVSA